MRFPRMSDMARSGRLARLGPSRSRRAAVRAAWAGNRDMMASAVSDLPEPDSPTMHRVSPRSTWKETPCTARSVPAGTGRLTRRSSTVRTRSLIGTSTAVLRCRDVAQTVAHHVDREDEKKEGDARNRDQPRIEEHQALGLGDH